MKILKILTLTFTFGFLGILASTPAFSQAVSFGVGADVTFPQEDLEELVSTGYGATGLAKIGIIPIVDLTGGVEYIKFTDKSITVNNVTEEGTGSAFGILVGGRLNFLVFAYVGAEGGTYSFTKKVAGSEQNVTRGVFVPQLGVKLGMFDLSARYISAAEDSFWGLRGLIWF